MTLETLATFAVLWTLAAASPGPNVAFTVGTGLVIPLPTAFFAAAGVALSGLIYAALVSMGLGTLLTASAEAFAVVKWFGVAYLLWLAWRQWRAAERSVPKAEAGDRTSAARLLLRGAAVMLANPKAMLAYAAIFPAFITPEAPPLPQFALLSLTSATCSFLVHGTYVVLAGRLGGWQALRGRSLLVGRVSAALYALAAVTLALVRRGAG